MPTVAAATAFIMFRQLSICLTAADITCTCVTVTNAPFVLTGGAVVTTTADVVIITAPGVVTVLRLVNIAVVDQVAQYVEDCVT